MKIITMRKDNHHHQGNENTLEGGYCGLRLTRHISINLQVVIQGRSRMKHHIKIRIQHL
jgi:hypothetical protein